MLKTFPIMIEVEEVALGPVLRRLNDMPGIAKLHLDLGHSGAARADEKKVARPSGGGGRDGNGETVLAKAVAGLMRGQKTVAELSAEIGGPKTRVYGAIHQLKGKGLVEMVDKGTYKLTDKALAELKAAQSGTAASLPKPEAPAAVAKTLRGRAKPGSGNIVLRAALDAGPVAPADLRQHMAAKGMSEKSISGVLDRAKRDGLIKRNGSELYELTVKGQKLELTEAAHG
ncbi:helix-turn-helix domain-containing protein [Bradyrhizobium diazoefficiens]|uniref:helix-turn-helix domain-containing protein n=1 Tax=Bradyrhizobium diazoefficiens TaxID=1355477 RepID=UPI00272A6CAC|nr:helix-turn-helix domain-containing protein [Bradyrhizobium diazoefficiens]WLA75037.1 helix-turn-helix domain-containing protein [Bradyrhizobium diazoefficiens]